MYFLQHYTLQFGGKNWKKTNQYIRDGVGKESFGVQHVGQHLRCLLGPNDLIMCILEHFYSCTNQSCQGKNISPASSGSQNDMIRQIEQFWQVSAQNSITSIGEPCVRGDDGIICTSNCHCGSSVIIIRRPSAFDRTT